MPGRNGIMPGGEVMTYVERESIQPGWSVWASDGEQLGDVIRVEPESIIVKKGGLIPREMAVPRDTVVDVETGRVEIGMTRSELEAKS